MAVLVADAAFAADSRPRVSTAAPWPSPFESMYVPDVISSSRSFISVTTCNHPSSTVNAYNAHGPRAIRQHDHTASPHADETVLANANGTACTSVRPGKPSGYGHGGRRRRTWSNVGRSDGLRLRHACMVSVNVSGTTPGRSGNWGCGTYSQSQSSEEERRRGACGSAMDASPSAASSPTTAASATAAGASERAGL